MIHEEPPQPSGSRLSLDVVLAEERPAWVEADDILYHYDGINCWHRQLGEWMPATCEVLPAEGWWHRPDCPCAFCQTPPVKRRVHQDRDHGAM